MKDVLLKILTLLDQNSVFLTQIAADSIALQTLVCELHPGANERLNELKTVERDTFQQIVETQRAAIRSLVSTLARMTN